jgi:hypothetical protein
LVKAWAFTSLATHFGDVFPWQPGHIFALKWAFKVWTKAKIDYLKTFILMEPYACWIIFGLKKLDNG